MLSDGSLAAMTIEDNSITGDKIVDGNITSSKLDNNLNNVINSIKENMSPTNYAFKSQAYTTNTTGNIFTINKDEDKVYTASVTFDNSVSFGYFRFKFGDKASEVVLKDSMDFTVISDKDILVQIGLIFNGNWANGFYCKSDILQLKAGVEQTHNVE